jgi:hypothetical protein
VLKVYDSLNVVFYDVINDIDIIDDIKPYIIDVMRRPSEITGSIVVATNEAVSFIDNQQIGDWALYSCSMLKPLKHRDVIEECGRRAYRRCHLLLGKRVWAYDYLSSELPTLTTLLRRELSSRKLIVSNQ